jgi:hypothetical protein
MEPEKIDIVRLFIEAMEKGKLQQCIHGEWVDVDPEKITIGYLKRAWKFRIK